MAINIIDFEIDLIAIKYPGIEKYKKAKLLLEACKMFYQNQTPPKISKKNLKIAVDAILHADGFKAMGEWRNDIY